MEVLDQMGLPYVGTAMPGTERPEAYYFEQFCASHKKWCTLVKEVATMLKRDLMGNNCPSNLFFFH